MRKGSKKIFLCLIVIILTLFMASCSGSSAGNPADSSGDKNNSQKIVITGLGDKDIEIAAEDLKNMELATRQAKAIDSAGKETDYTARGPLFDDILKKYGKSQKELKGIRVTAGDGYSIEIPEEVLKNRDIMLAVELNGKELDSNSKPVRIVVPEERAMYWVKNASRIEILKSAPKKEAGRLIFIDTASKLMELKDYDYYEEKDKAFKTGDLLDKFKSGEGSDTLSIKASDRLAKNETRDNFLKGFIKITGKNAPAFVSQELPVGMSVKSILWFSIGEDVYFSARNGLASLNKAAMDGKDGVLLRDVMKEAGIAQADKYVLTGLDGYTAEVESRNMDSCLITVDGEGNVSVYFKDLPKGMNIKGLLSIGVKK